MLTINRAQLALAIAQCMGAKGSTKFTLDEVIVPTINLGDIANTPYSYPWPVPIAGSVESTGGAAAYPYVGIRPAANKILQVTTLHISAAAANLACSIQLMTAAQITALLAGPTFSNAVYDLGSDTVGKAVASQCFYGDSAAVVDGYRLSVIKVPAGQTVQVEFPRPGVMLVGNDQGGRPAVAVSSDAFLSVLRVGFFGREFTLAGQ